MSFTISLTPQAKRALSQDLPESVAVACWEFIHGQLAENPHRVGKQLRGSSSAFYAARRGEFRIIYEIREEKIVVNVVNVRHRRDAYRNLS